ncbi:uncharacterized protein LTR77_006748 [Saxophila tyrrhenica]|uniref:Integral membrane protein n=1 Tax=Saxophila tyrrhenica TaxID=1690608 RepID=A0AAV9P936_9PEZI|nr:hypothetical protein LTR77_006748 [Saxophila tyrrhenica]
MDTPLPSSPSTWRILTSYLLVSVSWGFTTPFLRLAALSTPSPPARPALSDPNAPWLKRKVLSGVYAVVDLLRNPKYAIPLLVNVTGSVWFFLLVGEAELSLTVPITNSLAFLFTVLGEWWAEGKVISRGLLLRLLGSVDKRLMISRYLAGYDFGARRYSAVCSREDLNEEKLKS